MTLHCKQTKAIKGDAHNNDELITESSSSNAVTVLPLCKLKSSNPPCETNS